MTLDFTPACFQQLLLQWFDLHGRKHLPWQENKTPYRVWVSEIMLQQTQVSTVIPYFNRFMQQFPDLSSLAHAKEDAVLHLWAGLGYYSRARNLHRAAQIVCDRFAGAFPNALSELQTLPGIGQSTAGAILSIAFNVPAPILDGNVKRVLSRLHGISDPINEKNTEIRLWELAKQYTPTGRIADYTQAMMDLGATLCTRSQPQCHLCPMKTYCIAYATNQVDTIPAKKTVRKLPVRTATFLILRRNDEVLLCKRPPTGIWGGLWGLPELAGQAEKESIHTFCQKQYQITIRGIKTLPSFRHTFSHYHLTIFPVIADVQRVPIKIMDDSRQIWYHPHEPAPIGLPKPVQTIMSMLI